MNARTEKAIATLHPKIRQLVTDGVNKADVALSGRADMIIVQALRTFNEQTKLYLQKPKVTNAKAGQSYHNYGLAIDIVLIIDGRTASWEQKIDFDGDGKADWQEVVTIFKSFGWEAGIDWKFRDAPHFQKTFGYSVRQLLALHQAGKVDAQGFVKI